MEELLARIERRTGLPPDKGREVLGILGAYLDRNAPPTRMAELYAAVPGARELTAGRGGGGMFGMIGGGLMGVYSQLTGLGLSTQQMQGAGDEMLAFAREKVGNDAVDEIIASVPMLKQLL